MLLNHVVHKLIEELEAEQGDAVDLVRLALPSVEEASFDPMKQCLRALQRQAPMLQLLSWDRRKSDLGPFDTKLDARGCKADVNPRHGEQMCTITGSLHTWRCGRCGRLSLLQHVPIVSCRLGRHHERA